MAEVRAVGRAMGVTFVNLFRRPITVMYPDIQRAYPDRFRNRSVSTDDFIALAAESSAFGGGHIPGALSIGGSPMLVIGGRVVPWTDLGTAGTVRQRRPTTWRPRGVAWRSRIPRR